MLSGAALGIVLGLISLVAVQVGHVIGAERIGSEARDKIIGCAEVDLCRLVPLTVVGIDNRNDHVSAIGCHFTPTKWKRNVAAKIDAEDFLFCGIPWGKYSLITHLSGSILHADSQSGGNRKFL